MKTALRPFSVLVLALLAGSSLPKPVLGQQRDSCNLLCAPTFSVWPEVHHSHLLSNPRVRDLETGAVSELRSRNNLLLLFVVGVPTQLPRVSLVFDAGWLLTAKAQQNPFTEYGASRVDDVRANLPSVAGGVSIAGATLSSHVWAHDVRLVGTIDWIASGMPEAGDELPKGERVFLDDVQGVSLSIGLKLPIAPG